MAVVGAAGRFPGGGGLEGLWRLCVEGRTAIGAPPADRWDPGGQVAAGGFLDDVASFDPEAFGLTERDALHMDPQQRLFLEVAAEVLDAAGGRGARAGVFAGAGGNDYVLRFAEDPRRIAPVTALGNLDNMVAARVAQVLGLTGPALTTNAACASSLVAVHLACRSLLAGECDLAIAGGVELYLSPTAFTMFTRAGVVSPSQRCRPFAADADGFVPGEGAGAVALKLLDRAVADGDPILGVVLGSAVNNDGAALSGMAPSPRGQIDVIRRALADAGVEPGSISYVQAHGTATPIGDAVEVQALAEVFGARAEPCALGSIKSNIGHLFTAAGVAGLVQTLLAMRHRQLPPIAGCAELNPRIGFDRVGVRPVRALAPWTAPGPLRAGISAFGVGGTNCHVVVEQPPEAAPPPPARDAELLCIAAPDEAELARVASAVAGELRGDIAAAAVAINRRAARLPVRAAIVARDLDDARARLRAVRTGARPRGAAKLAFVFSGPGSQYLGMARAFHDREPIVRAAIDACDELLAPRLPRRLRSYLFDAPGMDQIDVTQPVVFSVGYALAQWALALGLRPDAVLGHSASEYIAATIAGVFDLPTALALVTERGACMARSEPGAMAAVFAPEARVRPVVAAYAGELDLAAINEPGQVVVSGARGAMDRALAALAADGVASRELAISCAAHSPLMEPVQDAFDRALAGVQPAAPAIPFYSAVSGARHAGALDRAYWRHHLRAPVEFARAVQAAAADGVTAFLELGASGALSHCIAQVLGARAVAVPVIRRSHPDSWEPAMTALGALLEAGVDFDAGRLGRGLPAATAPAYPYRRRRFFIGDDEPRADETRLALDTEPSIRDHVARGVPIAPAARLLELALAGAAGGVADVVIGRPLALDAGPRLASAARGADRVAVASRPETGGAVVEHLSGRPAPLGDRPAALDVDAIRARCTEVEAATLYDRLAASGLDYGPAMRPVRALWLGDGEVLARVEVDGDARAFDPVVVDGAMQAIAGLTLGLSDDGATYLGFAMAHVAPHAPTPARGWAHVALRSPLAAGAESFRCDVAIADDTGAVCAAFRDVGLKRVRDAAELELVIAPVAWQPQPAPAMRRALPEAAALLAPADCPAAAAVRRALQDAGVHVLGAELPGDVDAARAALARVLPVDAVVCLGAGPRELLCVARAAMEAQVAELELCAAGPDGGAIGFLRALAAEAPGWRCRAIEGSLDDGAAIAAEWLAASDDQHVLLRGGQRLVPAIGDTVASGAAPSLRDRGVYWIAGGTGGIGAAIAEDLAARCGARLLITGRRENCDDALRAAVERAGGELLYVQADVADEAAMARARDAAIERWGAIDGAVHAAGLLDDELIRTREVGRADAVLAPKERGGRVFLDVLGVNAPPLTPTLSPPGRGGSLTLSPARGRGQGEGAEAVAPSLDFVLLCSSLASLAAGPGQSDYAAANAALDALARDRDGVTAINFGPWREVGMVAAPSYQAALAAQGLVPLSPRDGVRALWAALATGARNVVAVGLQPGLDASLRARFNRVAAAAPAPAVVDDDAPAPPVRAFLLDQLASALKLPRDRVDPRTPFARLGVDSLMAVELVLRIERRYRTKLFPTLLFEYPNVDELAVALTDRFGVTAPAPAPAPRPGAPARADGGYPALLVGDGALQSAALAPRDPGPGELAIEVRAAGVNFIDLLAVAGMHPILGDASFVPGHEVAGVVTAVGDGVTDHRPGDRVMAILRDGGYAARAVTSAASVARLPDAMSFTDGAAIVITGLTAIACVEHHGRVRAGERVLVQAAAGATGTACVQLAVRAGAVVFGTASPGKHDHLRALGVAHAIDYTRADFADAVRAITASDRPLDVVIDSLSGDAITRGLALLRPGGRFIEIGAAGVVDVPPLDPRELFARDLSFAGCNVGRLDADPDRVRAALARLTELLAAGALRPAVGHSFPLADAAEAHALLRARKNVGKVVLTS